jgi:DNA invertase Pin-like site-specific DNA recombinase
MLKKEIKELIEAVGYLRLSRDDGDDESSSITNQRSIIKDWADKNGFIITDWYIDDGYSGHSMDRPDFNRLKDDLTNKKVRVVIAKNLSRIGRNNAQVNLFLDNMAIEGNRVITVSGDYDTEDESTHDMVGIRTWVDERYVKDSSRNIRAAIDRMQKEGRFICQVPYAYELDPFNKGVYYVDKTVAHYVVEMFDMYLNGYGVRAIAQEFTKRRVPTYWMLVKQRLERRGQQYKGKHTSGDWTPSVILKMLKNDFYIGTLTLAKTKRRTINGKKIPQKDADLIRFEDAHEPLIDKQTFKLVQEILAERSVTNYRGSKKNEPCIFSGKLYCSDCGTRLTTGFSAKIQRYVCRKYHLYGTDYCTSHTTNDRNLTAALIYFLKHCRENLAEAIADLKIMSDERKTQYQRDGIEILLKDKERIEKEIQVLIEQKMRETIANQSMKEFIDRTYASMINGKYADLQSITIRLEEMEEEHASESDMKKELNSVLDIFDSIISTKELTRRQVETIVEKIIVHEDGGLDIFLKGDLHELCTNYVQFKYSNKEDIVKTIAKYAETQQGRIMKRKCEQYVRAQGVRFDQIVFAKIYKRLIEYGYLVQISERKGCTVPDIDKLKLAYKDDNVMAYSSRVQKLSVTIQFLHKVCQWHKDTKPKYRRF